MAEIYDYSAGFDDPNNKNAWFANIIGNEKTILEVGCATGYVGEYLVNNHRCHVTGIEFVGKAAEIARARKCYDEVIIGDIQDANTVATIHERQFDFILFGDVLEHLMTPEKALAIVTPLLKPDGHILICVPSIVHWSIRRDILLGKFEYTDTGPLDRTHVHFFTPKTARELSHQCGFKINASGGVVWLPSVCYKLPNRLRWGLERAFAKIMPNIFHGQVLFDLVKA